MTAKTRLLSAAIALLCNSLCGFSPASAATQAPGAPVSASPAASVTSRLSAPVVTTPVAAQIAPQIDVENLHIACGKTIELHALYHHAGTPINGASLQFKIDDASVGQGVTEANGTTKVLYKLGDSLTPGMHTIHVTLPGDGKTRAIVGSAKLMVGSQSPTTLKAKIEPVGHQSLFVIRHLTGHLSVTSADMPLNKQTISLMRGSNTVDTTTTVNGDFEFTVKTIGDYYYKVVYDGNGNCMGSNHILTNFPQ